MICRQSTDKSMLDKQSQARSQIEEILLESGDFDNLVTERELLKSARDRESVQRSRTP